MLGFCFFCSADYILTELYNIYPLVKISVEKFGKYRNFIGAVRVVNL